MDWSTLTDAEKAKALAFMSPLKAEGKTVREAWAAYVDHCADEADARRAAYEARLRAREAKQSMSERFEIVGDEIRIDAEPNWVASRIAKCLVKDGQAGGEVYAVITEGLTLDAERALLIGRATPGMREAIDGAVKRQYRKAFPVRAGRDTLN